MDALNPSDTLFFFVHSKIPTSTRYQSQFLEVLAVLERVKTMDTGYADESIERIARINGFRDDNPEPRPWRLIEQRWPRWKSREVF